METGLPYPWTIRFSKSKRREYYFNPETKQSQWEFPNGTNKDMFDMYMAKHPLKIRCLHLLIKHIDSRRPSSHRMENITLSKEDAINELHTYQSRLTDGEMFEDLARQRSDCSSFKRGGDLGYFTKGEMQPAFELVAFNLNVGEVSDVVETDSGVHLIKRID